MRGAAGEHGGAGARGCGVARLERLQALPLGQRIAHQALQLDLLPSGGAGLGLQSLDGPRQLDFALRGDHRIGFQGTDEALGLVAHLAPQLGELRAQPPDARMQRPERRRQLGELGTHLGEALAEPLNERRAQHLAGLDQLAGFEQRANLPGARLRRRPFAAYGGQLTGQLGQFLSGQRHRQPGPALADEQAGLARVFGDPPFGLLDPPAQRLDLARQPLHIALPDVLARLALHLDIAVGDGVGDPHRQFRVPGGEGDLDHARPVLDRRDGEALIVAVENLLLGGAAPRIANRPDRRENLQRRPGGRPGRFKLGMGAEVETLNDLPCKIARQNELDLTGQRLMIGRLRRRVLPRWPERRGRALHQENLCGGAIKRSHRRQPQRRGGGGNHHRQRNPHRPAPQPMAETTGTGSRSPHGDGTGPISPATNAMPCEIATSAQWRQ
jgi:hypothetical protein